MPRKRNDKTLDAKAGNAVVEVSSQPKKPVRLTVHVLQEGDRLVESPEGVAEDDARKMYVSQGEVVQIDRRKELVTNVNLGALTILACDFSYERPDGRPDIVYGRRDLNSGRIMRFDTFHPIEIFRPDNPQKKREYDRHLDILRIAGIYKG